MEIVFSIAVGVLGGCGVWLLLRPRTFQLIMRSIRDAVHGDLDESRAVYQWVSKLCVALGASPDDLVPFEKYANAALSLLNPSSAARALAAGAPNIERVDRLVQALGAQKHMA